MPKPHKLDEIKKRLVLRHVIEGESVERAAQAVGCCRRTVERAAGRDPLFGWRLQTARAARDEIRRQQQQQERLDAEAATFCSPSGLLRELRAGLAKAWAADSAASAGDCDFSANRDAA